MPRCLLYCCVHLHSSNYLAKYFNLSWKLLASIHKSLLKMFSQFTRFSTENCRKIVPNAVKSRFFSFFSTQSFHLSCLGTAKLTSRSVLNSQSRSLHSIVRRPIINQFPKNAFSLLPCQNIISRGLKTRKSAAKRFIKTGTGELKFGHAGKRHNTSKKSKTRQRRLNQLVRLMTSNIC